MADARPRVLATAPPIDVVLARVAGLRRRIEDAGRDPAGVHIVAVTKGFTTSAVEAARRAGLYDIGENYADELLAKAAVAADTVSSEEMSSDTVSSDTVSSDEMSSRATSVRADENGDQTEVTRWHYLGAVQRRRVRILAPVVSCWQTLSRAVEGEAIATHAPGAKVFVEIDVTEVPGRNGCRPSEAPALVTSLRGLGLDVLGLMTVGGPGPPEESRRAFRVTAELAHDLGLLEVSMGMTDDLEVALSEGSTMVRVGRALFGERPLRPA